LVDNSAGAADASGGPGVNSTAGYLTNDILVNADPGVGILSQQLLIDLAGGPPNPIYQHTFGNGAPSYGPPNNLLAGFAPGILYDTYLAAGSPSTGAVTAPGATVAGKSQDLGGPGGAGAAVFTNTDIDAAWGSVGASGTNYLSARVTLHNTVSGVWSYRVNYADGSSNIIQNGPIAAGVLLQQVLEVFEVGDIDETDGLGGDDRGWLPGSLVTGGPLPTNDDDDPDQVAWSLVSLIGPDGPEAGGSVDASGAFSWQSAGGDSLGEYTATIQGINSLGLLTPAGTDSGTFTFRLVPEPASVTLLGLAMVGVLGYFRRR
jgi:hypothetical protein